jgi:hypothetical protein
MKSTCVLIGLSSLAFACAAQPPNENQAPAQASPGTVQMQGGMRDMQALMDRIHETADPQERHRLMREHMQTMQRGMAMMDQMRAQGDAPAQDRECAQGDTECRMQRMQGQQQLMGQRMGMMQAMMGQMMGQMMQRDAEPPTAKPADPQDHEAHH